MRRIILDTDIGNDVDDVIALAVLHALHKQGKIIFDSILVSKAAERAPVFAELFGLKMQNPVPVAKAQRGVAIPFETYLHLTGIFLERDPDTKAKLAADYPTSNALLRARLEAAEDKSIDLLTIGFLSNIGDFLEDADNAALFNAKVARVHMMAGNFEEAKPEFNVMMDVPAFNKVLDVYAGEVNFVGFELGRVRYPESSIRKLYESARHDMIWLSYMSYRDKPHNRQCWDPITALVASGCFEDAYNFSAPGTVRAEANGTTPYTANENGRHRYVTATPDQEAEMIKAMTSLVESL